MVSTKAHSLDIRTARWNHPDLIDTRDTPYGRITVRSLLSQVSVFENDALCFETEGTSAEEFVHLAALQHPDPESVLILGGGAEGLINELQKYAPRRIDYVELNGAMLDMVLQHLPSVTVQSMSADNVRTIIEDPRRFLESAGLYDLILVAMPEPMSGQTNRFYTREFFERCAKKLNAGGVLAFRLKSAENLWTPQLRQRTAGIYQALKTAFAHITVLPGVTNIFAASNSPLPSGPDPLISRLRHRAISARLIIPEYIHYLYTNDRFARIHNILENEKVITNSDNHPICYQYALMIWLSKFYPVIAFVVLKPVTGNGLGFLLISGLTGLIIAAVFIVVRGSDSLRRALIVAMAGFIGMVMETVLILHYQTKSGVLYRDIGLLLTAFMVGLALGAWTVERWMSRFSGSGDRGRAADYHVKSHGKGTVHRRMGAWLLIGFSVLILVVVIDIKTGIRTGIFSIASMLAVTGFFVAGIFAHTSLHGIADQRRVVSALYSADLIGGCIGSLVGALFMIPIFGLSITSGLMIVLTLLCMIIITGGR
ncbi:MAG TPA: hypothetical protein ENL08_01520 [Bacteroidetes bacterium]|nr:hypothetical protein [Bacteroidota bacterium]